jgi:hypothetical protein
MNDDERLEELGKQLQSLTDAFKAEIYRRNDERDALFTAACEYARSAVIDELSAQSQAFRNLNWGPFTNPAELIDRRIAVLAN